MAECKNRNVGLDLLRLWAMFGVVCLHVMIYAVHRGDTAGIGGLPLSEMILNRMCGCAVNAFALLSGFFLYGRAFRSARIVHVCACVVFYGVLTSVVALAFAPGFGWHDFGKSCARFDSYWYVLAYLGVLLIMPVLSRAIDLWRECPARGILVFTAMVLASALIRDDPIWKMNRGYCFLWLSFMFVLGGFLKARASSDRGGRRAWTYLLLFVVLTSVIGIVAYFISHGHAKSFAPGHTARILLTQYNSPLLVLQALLIFSFGIWFQPTGRFFRWFSGLGRYAFGAYLLHMAPAFFDFAFAGRFAGLRGNVLMIAIVSAGYLLIGILVDAVRSWLFSRLRIDLAIEWAGRTVDIAASRFERFFANEKSIDI